MVDPLYKGADTSSSFMRSLTIEVSKIKSLQKDLSEKNYKPDYIRGKLSEAKKTFNDVIYPKLLAKETERILDNDKQLEATYRRHFPTPGADQIARDRLRYDSMTDDEIKSAASEYLADDYPTRPPHEMEILSARVKSVNPKLQAQLRASMESKAYTRPWERLRPQEDSAFLQAATAPRPGKVILKSRDETGAAGITVMDLDRVINL